MCLGRELCLPVLGTDRAFILRDCGLGADFLLLLGLHGFASKIEAI